MLTRGIQYSAIRETEAKAIIRVLVARFQSVPQSVKEKVYAVDDIEHLDELTDKAATCQSLEEFAQHIKPSANNFSSSE